MTPKGRPQHAARRDFKARGLADEPTEAAMLADMAATCCKKYGFDRGQLDAALRDLAEMDALGVPVRPWHQQSAH